MKIYASEGYMLTDGNVYGKIIDLGKFDKEENYHQITEEEYYKLMAESEEIPDD